MNTHLGTITELKKICESLEDVLWMLTENPQSFDEVQVDICKVHRDSCAAMALATRLYNFADRVEKANAMDPFR